VFGLDIGLLSTMSRIPADAILHEHKLFSEFKGALTENFVAQQLITHEYDHLYYWVSEGIAEVDFVIDHDLSIFPLEVKSGMTVGHKKRQHPGKYPPL
jgi:predicted AAA+ superfamily ATPase